MKHNILIVMSSLHLGGAETALLGLLEALDYRQYDIDLFLYKHEGELLPYLPKQVKLLPENPAYSCLAEAWTTTLLRGCWRVVWQRILAKIQAGRKFPGINQASINGDYIHRRVVPLLPAICPEKEYDLAVSFIFPHYIVPAKVRAKRRVAWIHTDYTSVVLDVPSQLEMWRRYDKIISISQSVSESFIKVFPFLAERLEIIENILPVDYIRRRADEFLPDWPGCPDGKTIKILSIGRFSPQKNFDNVPDICRRIVDSGVGVKWYLIGYGSEETLIRQRIREACMDGNVIILGKKDNPYPYIKNCDVYVQPSRYEGKSVAVREAQFFGKPVIVTSYPTASSQVQDEEDGKIVPLDNVKCAQNIAELLKNRKQLKLIAEKCKRKDFALQREIIKFYKLA